MICVQNENINKKIDVKKKNKQKFWSWKAQWLRWKIHHRGSIAEERFSELEGRTTEMIKPRSRE